MPASAPVAAVSSSKRPAVLADGTYATQTAVVETIASAVNSSASVEPNLRALLLGGDFFLGGVIAGTVTKLMLRLKGTSGVSGKQGGSLA